MWLLLQTTPAVAADPAVPWPLVLGPYGVVVVLVYAVWWLTKRLDACEGRERDLNAETRRVAQAATQVAVKALEKGQGQ